MKNARLLALAAATILSGCAQGGIDPFAGSSAPPAPPAEDLQYFVRYPDGTMVPVQLPPSVVAGFGGPQSGAAQGSAQVGGVVYAPPLVASTPPASAPNFYAAPPPAGAARPVAAPQPAPQVAARQPAPYEFPAAPAAAPLPAALSAPRSSAPPASSGGFAQAATAPGIAQMDPALAEALRRQGIDPGDVVGLEYSDGPPAAASAPGSAAALNPQVVAPQRAMGMAPS